MKLHLVSLGCARNLVDSEVMLGRLLKVGCTITQNPAEAETIIINTCSFIESAVNESIDTILELAALKQTGVCRRLVVAGCLPERFREEIVRAMPEVDLFLGTGAFDTIVPAVAGALNASKCVLPDPNAAALQGHETPRVQSSPYVAYLKIAEGCSKHCTYCIIPKLRGQQRSRPLEDIVDEARSLISAGVKELILIAQDTSSYGTELTPSTDLDRLLNRLADISDSVWIRALYGHPETIQESMIRTVAMRPNICAYFDIPIQHVSSAVLKKMDRRYRREDLCRLFEKIRSIVPDAVLRTTVMVGFPGETDRDLEAMSAFIKEVRFDHLGVFTYSDSEDLPSHRFSGHVSKSLAQERYDLLMSCQAEVSFEKNRERVGRECKVLVEQGPEKNVFSGRTAFQAPEVDGVTYVHSKTLRIGSFADVKITKAFEYDLVGEAVRLHERPET